MSRSSTTSGASGGAAEDNNNGCAQSSANAPTTPIRRTSSVKFAPITSDLHEGEKQMTSGGAAASVDQRINAEREEDVASTATTTESISTEEFELPQAPFASIGASFDGNSLAIGSPSALSL